MGGFVVLITNVDTFFVFDEVGVSWIAVEGVRGVGVAVVTEVREGWIKGEVSWEDVRGSAAWVDIAREDLG